MATACILHRREETNNLVRAVDSGQIGRQTAAQTASAQQTNFRTTLHDLTNIPRDLSAEEALHLEIERLCTATLTIDQAFNDIGERLSDASKEQNKLADLHDTCCTLEAQWKEHHRAYITLLWRSREFAGEAQAAVDDFREMVLPSLRDRDRTPEEKQLLIREQVELLQEAAQPSEQICQEFNDFSDTLDRYIRNFSRIVEGLEISEHSQKVDRLRGDLRDAKSDMEDVSRDVKDLGWQFAQRVAVVGIAALLAFATPCLFASLAIAGVMIAALSTDCLQIKDSGAQFLEARRQYNLAVARYEAIKADYDLESACLNQMVGLELTLQDARPLVQDVTMKLGIFASVWAAITADLRKLKNTLRLADNPSSQLFVMRIRNLETMYGYLSQALRHYQVTVQLPNQAGRDMVGVEGRA